MESIRKLFIVDWHRVSTYSKTHEAVKARLSVAGLEVLRNELVTGLSK